MKEQVLLIRQKARWIKQRLLEVNKPLKEEIYTGSRLLYRGRYYYCQLEPTPLNEIEVEFRHSRFTLRVPERYTGKENKGLEISKSELLPAMDSFFLKKAKEKLLPRLKYWQKTTGLKANWRECHTVVEKSGQLF